MNRALAITLCMCIGYAHPAFSSAQDRLKQTQQEIKQSEKRQKDLANKQAGITKELRSLQRKMVRTVAAVQKNEKALLIAEEKLATTNHELKEKQEQIETNKERLETLVSVALRFSRMPPEAMVMMPDDSTQTLRVSKALSMLSKDIKQETQDLAQQRKDLESLKRVLGKQKTDMQAKKKTLEAKRKGLQKQVRERKRLQASLKQDQKKESDKAKRLAKKAKGLRDLLKRLAAENSVSADYSKPSGYKGKMRSFVRAKGKIRMPVTGRVKEKYGASNKAGGASRGVTIATASQAQVIAPYDGEVIFAGKFLNYGRMTILRHRDDFHTLLAGFSRLDVQTGEFLLEGEPIGAMGSGSAEKRLYIELRKKNQPVNPRPWIRGL